VDPTTQNILRENEESEVQTVRASLNNTSFSIFSKILLLRGVLVAVRCHLRCTSVGQANEDSLLDQVWVSLSGSLDGLICTAKQQPRAIQDIFGQYLSGFRRSAVYLRSG